MYLHVTPGFYSIPFQSLTFKEKVTSFKIKEKSSEEGPSYKYLLLGIVRLIHADPILMLHVSRFLYTSLYLLLGGMKGVVMFSL